MNMNSSVAASGLPVSPKERRRASECGPTLKLGCGLASFAPPPFHWTDRGRVFQMGEKVKTAAGTYANVLVVEEWDEETPEGAFQTKYYAPGDGLVKVGYRGPDPEQEELELVRRNILTPLAWPR